MELLLTAILGQIGLSTYHILAIVRLYDVHFVAGVQWWHLKF